MKEEKPRLILRREDGQPRDLLIVLGQTILLDLDFKAKKYAQNIHTQYSYTPVELSGGTAIAIVDDILKSIRFQRKS